MQKSTNTLITLFLLGALIILTANSAYAEGDVSLVVNITYVANFHPTNSYGDMSSNIFLGNSTESFGADYVIIPLIVNNSTIIDIPSSGDVPGLHIARGEDNNGKFIEITAYGVNTLETRESIKFNVELINGIFISTLNGPGDGPNPEYEHPDTDGCGIVEGNPQDDNSGNDEYHVNIEGDTGDFCSITRVGVDRVRLYYDASFPPPGEFSATLSAAPFYPQGLNMLWHCNAQGGSGNFAYDFFFGDGQQQLNYSQNNAFHTYPAAGTYNAYCAIHDLTTAQIAISPTVILVLNGTSIPLNITNITTIPPLPLTNNGSEQNIAVNFQSNKFPINVSFNLFNNAGAVIHAKPAMQLQNSSGLPVIYTLPANTAEGDYTLKMTVKDFDGNSLTFTLGAINVVIDDDDDDEDDDRGDIVIIESFKQEQNATTPLIMGEDTIKIYPVKKLKTNYLYVLIIMLIVLILLLIALIIIASR